MPRRDDPAPVPADPVLCRGDVDSIRFTWQQKDSLKRPDKDELMRRIRVELEKAGPDFRPPLEELLDKISGTPRQRCASAGR